MSWRFLAGCGEKWPIQTMSVFEAASRIVVKRSRIHNSCVGSRLCSIKNRVETVTPTKPIFTIIETSSNHIPSARELFFEYATSLNFELCFQSFDQELAALPGKYASPEGFILLAYLKDGLAGCVALRPLSPGIAEMKRLYVRPKFQGMGLGKTLVDSLLLKAKTLGYEKVRLDTVPAMLAAINLYKAMGFKLIEPYCENPIPGASYYETTLIAQ
jgi:putative acetyltransferase